jgi:hypothetical protein
MSELTTVLATYGAIVSTGAVLWNIYRDLTDGGRLRVDCFIGFMALPGVGADHTYKLFFGVTNVGRRPIMVTKVGGAQGGKYFIVPPHPGMTPRMLAPGEYLHEWLDDPLAVLDRTTKFLGAWDSFDRAWKADRRMLKRLLKEADDMRREKQRKQ